MMRKLIGLSLLLLLCFPACGEGERYEAVTKLRSIGTSASPAWAALDRVNAGQAIEFDFYSVVPKGTTVSAEPFIDSAAAGKPNFGDLEVVSTTPQQELGAFTIMRTRARATLKADQMLIARDSTFTAVRYALKIVAGQEEEKVVGNFLIYRTDPWMNSASITITAPANGANTGSGDITLTAQIVEPQNEKYKVGWFVSSGKIRNRRSINTKLTEVDSGAQSIIVTLRGLQSGTFAFHAVDFTVP